MQIQEAFILLRNDLVALYGERESTLISHWVIEHITGLTRSARLIHHTDSFTAEQESDFHKFKYELLQWRPVQYVLGEAWFCGMKFFVDERVLIPRPETEELVEEVVDSRQWPVASRQLTVDSQQPIRVLDVGTGSGCIAVSLKKKKPEWEIWAVDLSTDALEVAKQNATSLAAEINFVQIDMLNEKSRAVLPVFDMIISNPPYIPLKDKAAMRENVLLHEPHLALFVSNDDPLIFYKEIIRFANTHLKHAGSLFFEIHDQLAEQVVSLLSANNYDQIFLKQDMQGRDRMISAIKSS
jgi:release factor glutamine methyltransferase